MALLESEKQCLDHNATFHRKPAPFQVHGHERVHLEPIITTRMQTIRTYCDFSIVVAGNQLQQSMREVRRTCISCFVCTLYR